jgi:threonine synthase
MSKAYRGLIEKYRAFLPVTAKTPVVTLLEGNTPLIPAPRLAALMGPEVELWLKYEGLNPTGSFKDRGMTMAISKAAEEGAKVVMCASTGNTSASAAAYAARAGMRCVVLLPKGAIALGKLSQALMHGARVVAVEGNFDDALGLVKQITASYPITLVNSINPYRIEGQKTGAFEVVEQLGGKAPDFHAIPVGNAGNITAYWKGYQEAKAHGMSRGLPVMLGFQAAGSAPIVKGRPIAHPKTLATAIKIGNPASWKQAEAARDQSRGLIDAVTDRQIIEAYRLLARLEGVFCEPASAASVAGALALGRAGYFKRQARRLGKRRLTLACVLTGHGIKDPDRAVAESPKPEVVKPTLSAITKLLKL